MQVPDLGKNEALQQPWLAYFPITLFGSTMGLFGLALALRAAGLNSVSDGVSGAGALVFLGLLALYVAKAIRFPGQVVAEWNHPVRLSFFPAANISLLLLSLLLQDIAPTLSTGMWVFAASTQAVLTLVIVSTWMSHKPFPHQTFSPAWFIPAVANVIVPLGGVHLGLQEPSWYFFSVGMLFWLILLTLVFNRIIFQDPLPGKLQPTLAILIAPPAVGFLAWIELNGSQIDAFARILMNTGLFFAGLIALQVPALLRLPFALSFWALSFPLAALTTAVFRYASLTGSDLFRVSGFALLGLLVITILVLGTRTVRAAVAGDICKPE